MQWIKRNLFLVVGGVVALALLGIAGFYLYTKIQQDQGVTEELNAATQKLEALAKRDPYPNPENISAAKDEGKRLQNFLTEVEKHFEPAPLPQELGNMQFRTYLDNTRALLLVDAQRAGVEVPTNYWFTFAAQKGAMTFTPSTLPPLATQLADIRTVCGVLFDAKVNSLVWLKRSPIDKLDDATGGQDYLNAKPVTNSWSVTMPYEVAFQGFSSELAAVLEGLAKLPQCFMVTNIVVEPAATASSPTDENSQSTDVYSRYGMMRPQAAAPGQDAAREALMQRYGGMGGGRYGRGARPMPVMPQAPVAVRPAAPRGPTTILDEKPLRFTLSIQAVKLKPTAAAAPAAAAPAAAAAAADSSTATAAAQ